jgi:hypothetical protein
MQEGKDNPKVAEAKSPEPPTPNAEVERKIADELNQTETEVAAADANPTDPLPDDEVKISEPHREEIKTKAGDVEAIHWTASEAIDHQRGFWWYFVVSLIAALIVGLSIWLKQWTTGGLALIILVTIIFIGRKPVRQINYTLTGEGLFVEDKLRPYSEFRAFGVRQDGPLWSIVLIPVKRFGMSTTMFITEDQGEKIVDAIGRVLPMENVQPDLVDRVIRRLKL